MGLINLKTNLKGYGFTNSPELYIAKGSVDLKFGSDEPGNGNSKQPFIQTRIPATDEPLQTGVSNAGPTLAGLGAGAAIGAIGGSILGSVGGGAIAGATVGLGIGLLYSNSSGDSLRLPSAGTGGPDFLVRGGTLLPGILVNDAIRLTKYFASTEGVLFTVKQNLLSRVSVRTQAGSGILNDGVYTPISTLIQAAGNAFGLHVNKQGLNPFAGTGPTSDNERLYGVKVTPQQSTLSNRLIQLYGTKFLTLPNSTPNSRFLGMNDISADPQILISYDGGPGSELGIGKTNIKLYNPTVRVNTLIDITDPTVNYLTLGYRGLNSITNQTKTTKNSNQLINPNVPGQLGEINIESDEFQLDNFRRIKGYVPTLYQQDFRDRLRQAIRSEAQSQTTLMSQAPSYRPGENKIIEQRVNLGDPGNKTGKNLWSYTSGVGTSPTSPLYGAASNNSIDRINALEIYQSEAPNNELGNDLVKFRIGVINNDTPTLKTYIHFRAFLDQISDSYNADWSPTKYIGRGENFYTYGGFDRKVSLGWTVAAQSKAELIPMYKRLNYLASICTPDYSAQGYMRGNIVTLTIGGYFYEQPGIITGFNYEMNDGDSSWEIGINDEGNTDPSVKELPHLIKVTGFNFIPIHTFVPRLQQNKFDDIGMLSSYGKEQYIALSAGEKTNYE